MKHPELPKETAERLDSYSRRLAESGDDEDILIERGRLYWALGMRREAINDYLAASRINPHGKAEQLLKAAYAVLDFYNKDLYNP